MTAKRRMTLFLSVMFLAFMFAIAPVKARADLGGTRIVLGKTEDIYIPFGSATAGDEASIGATSSKVENLSIKSSNTSVVKISRQPADAFMWDDFYGFAIAQVKKAGKSILTYKYRLNKKTYTKKYNVYTYKDIVPFSSFKAKGAEVNKNDDDLVFGVLYEDAGASGAFWSVDGKNIKATYKLKKGWKILEVYKNGKKVSNSAFKSGKTIVSKGSKVFYRIILGYKNNKNKRMKFDLSVNGGFKGQ